MRSPHAETRWVDALERLIDGLGRWLGLIWLILMSVILVNVISRYVFSQGFIQLEELQWHLYSTGFLLGLSFAVTRDVHVRVDVLRDRWSETTKAWVELYGILLLLLPFVALVLYAALPFVLYSFQTSEISQAPGGLPFRWFIKSMLPLAFFLLALASIARLVRVGALLFGGADVFSETSFEKETVTRA